jgi:hypothetical protein
MVIPLQNVRVGADVQVDKYHGDMTISHLKKAVDHNIWTDDIATQHVKINRGLMGNISIDKLY